MRRVILQDISIDRRREVVQRLGMQTLQTLGARERVYPALRVVNIRERVRLREPATRETDALSANTNVQECRLVTIVAGGVTPEAVQLLTLEFVLDSFSIRRIPNQRKHGSDSFDQHGPLSGIGVVKRGLRSDISVKVNKPQLFVPSYLNAIIPIRIPQQLLEPRSVEHLSDQKFAGSMLSHANALREKRETGVVKSGLVPFDVPSR